MAAILKFFMKIRVVDSIRVYPYLASYTDVFKTSPTCGWNQKCCEKRCEWLFYVFNVQSVTTTKNNKDSLKEQQPF